MFPVQYSSFTGFGNNTRCKNRWNNHPAYSLPLTRVVRAAGVPVGQGIDPPFCGRMANVVVMFWWETTRARAF